MTTDDQAAYVKGPESQPTPVAAPALQAWITGRDMVTEAELLLQMVAVRLGVPVDTRETIEGSRCANTPTPIRPPVKEANGHG